VATGNKPRYGKVLAGTHAREGRRTLRCDELDAMLIYSMSVSVDGFIADREGAFGWTAPNEEQFRFIFSRTLDGRTRDESD
jgi:hypothetical protein